MSNDPTVTEANTPRASNPLLTAALVGLLGMGTAVACGSDGTGNIDSSGGGKGGSSHSSGGSTGTDNSGGQKQTPEAGDPDDIFINTISTTEIALADFKKTCEDRGGFVTTSAQCAGSNLCRGLSYAIDGTTLTEHSCKGLSGCHGFGCVDLPEDSGLSGEEIYESGPCAGCHNDAFKGASTYTVFMHPGETAEAATARFQSATDLKLMATVAFGTQGQNDDGTQFSNMPSYRDKFSRAEIGRVVEYLKTLKSSTEDIAVPAH